MRIESRPSLRSKPNGVASVCERIIFKRLKWRKSRGWRWDDVKSVPTSGCDFRNTADIFERTTRTRITVYRKFDPCYSGL